jgi:alpha-tubulin suppressor-like RCC1 family protein
MSVTGPNTGFKIVNADGGPYTQDLGERYVSKDYLLDVYPNLIPGRTTPGLWAWGRNFINLAFPTTSVSGQLGDGTIVDKSSPVQIGSLTNWKQVSAGADHSLAIKTDGTLWAWGHQTGGYSSFATTVDEGALGDGTIINKSSPVQIGALTNWKQISGGLGFSVAVKTDGTIWTWGSNRTGQLGSATVVRRSSPVQIGSLTNWKQVAAGSYHTAAVKRDGTIWTWGENDRGQLGDGTVVRKSSPIQVGLLTNWYQVSCGDFYTAAIKTDGTLWVWGHNNDGQLGLGDKTHRSSPVQVGSLTNWKQVECNFSNQTVSSSYTLAIKTDGTLWAWGDNGNGHLGDGTTTSKSSPIQVGLLTNWKQISAGDDLSAAVKTDGTLWTWGNNGEGALGQGNITNRSSPVQVGSLPNWKQVSCGHSHILSILDGYI